MPSSRRDFFRSFLGRSKETSGNDVVPEASESLDDTSGECMQEATVGSEVVEAANENPEVALILDRFCLAYQGSFCSVCAEHCPEEGAIVTEQGKPRVEPDRCTGCKICQDVCPAPKNAIFTVASKPKKGMIGRWEENRVSLDQEHDSVAED